MDRDLLNQYINVFRTLSGIVEQSVRNYKIISEQVDASTAKVGKLLPMLKEALILLEWMKELSQV